MAEPMEQEAASETMRDRIAHVINRYKYTHDEYPLARLILEAMREPTEAMTRACRWPATDWDSSLEDVWRCMIDGAIAPDASLNAISGPLAGKHRGEATSGRGEEIGRPDPVQEPNSEVKP